MNEKCLYCGQAVYLPVVGWTADSLRRNKECYFIRRVSSSLVIAKLIAESILFPASILAMACITVGMVHTAEIAPDLR
jgi:hypothetical protein